MNISKGYVVMDRRYPHDCECCTFLGQYEEYDLYFCPQNGLPTVIARWGKQEKYHSCPVSFKSCVPELVEALQRAETRGLV